MKKVNKILFRVTAILIILSVVTTVLVSSLFAKYVTKGDLDPGYSRGAKWDIHVRSETPEKAVYQDNGDEQIISVSNTSEIIAPGTHGTLVKFTMEGNPETRHHIKFDLNLSIDKGNIGSVQPTSTEEREKLGSGYEDLILKKDENGNEYAEDYFPLLLTVGRRTGTDVKEMHFYMTMDNPDSTKTEQITTLKGLFDAIEYAVNNTGSNDMAPLSEYVDPNGWSGLPVEYYVNWDWFYDDAEIDAASIPTNVKEALKAYRSAELDTILGEEVYKRKILNENIDLLENLQTAVNSAKSASSADDKKNAITALENALSDAFSETSKEYVYEKTEEYEINWLGTRNTKFMKGCNFDGTEANFGSKFIVNTTNNYSILAEKQNTTYKSEAVNLFFRTIPERDSSGNVVGPGATIQPAVGEVIEYTFAAHSELTHLSGSNSRDPYAGVVFAIDENDAPYFLFGVFQKAVDGKDEYSGQKVASLSLGHGQVPSNGTLSFMGYYGAQSATYHSKYQLPGKDEAWFGHYKIVYEGAMVEDSSGKEVLGMKVQCYYMSDSAGNYTTLGPLMELPGARISVGIHARTVVGSSSNLFMMNVWITNAKLVRTTTLTSYDSILNNLVSKAQSVLDTVSEKRFDLAASASLTVQQVNG